MGSNGTRLDRRIQKSEHDAYRSSGKVSEPAACPDCGAVFHRGRWQWASRPEGAAEHRCPACNRIDDHYPAGIVTIEGPFFRQHREEVLGLVLNRENAEKMERPLHRIMSIVEDGDVLEVSTTDLHLPRCIGVALQRAYDGELDYHYEAGEQLLRVHWSR
ncbi:MAG: BCAM0308 family protein [Deltaproteobacteria bacterium]|nr:BCAM0308 family protein [Deltaproteobacteria bacterium]